MPRIRLSPLVVLALLALPAALPAHHQAASAASEMPAFVDRVWRVEESDSVRHGQMYVFLSDGTLVLASAGNRPAFGQWSWENGVFTLVEEGRPYRTDIVAVNDEELRLHLHDPGQGVDLRLVPAVSCVAMASARPAAESVPSTLTGSHWRLLEIGGAAAAAGIEATLDFPEEGKVAGRGSCNRFFGDVKIAADGVQFGPLGATKMACGAAADLQESRFLQALAASSRFRRDTGSLVLLAADGSITLRFAEREP